VLHFVLADLHIHTCLSPCAEVEMFPEAILLRAQELGLHMVAITDHNSAQNVAAALHAARGSGITVLPGMEVQSREDVHLLALFDTLEQVLAWQDEVYAGLPSEGHDADHFGEQLLLDAQGEPLGYLERMLVTSCGLSVDEVARRVAELGGLCIPAHVDRPMYSVISNLGFIPPGLGLLGAEISPNTGPQRARAQWPELAGYGLVGGGDAHRLNELSRRTTLKLAANSVAEIALALAGRDGREVWIDGVSTTRCA
jgi:3',5'-nucleoside bisphosphate phosphatase